jgi:hypothetical protein
MLPLETLTNYVADSNVVHYRGVVMIDDMNEEEAWLHSVMRDFNYIVLSGRYGPLFYNMLTDEAKLIINNMRECELRNMEVKCQ